jgi:hypothetical protein
MTWAVWDELAARPHLLLEFGEIDGADALIDDLGEGWRRITLDSRLDRRARRAALAHELVHDERGILFDAGSPAGLVAVEERAVQAEVVRRLVPPADLADRLARSDHPVTWRDVADWFDVPRCVAEAALIADTQTRHPSMASRPELRSCNASNMASLNSINLTARTGTSGRKKTAIVRATGMNAYMKVRPFPA